MSEAEATASIRKNAYFATRAATDPYDNATYFASPDAATSVGLRKVFKQ